MDQVSINQGQCHQGLWLSHRVRADSTSDARHATVNFLGGPVNSGLFTEFDELSRL